MWGSDGDYQDMEVWGIKRAAIGGFMLRTNINKVDLCQLIFNSNSATYIYIYM